MKHILILNRYDDIFSDFTKYIDHVNNKVSYITLKDFSSLIDKELSFQITALNEFESESLLASAIDIHKKAPIDYVLAFSEYDQDYAAVMRSSLNIKGSKIEDALLYRNKIDMKKALVDSNLKYPKYKKVNHYIEAKSFCIENSLPAILKPMIGAASEGVIKLEKIEDIPKTMDFSNYEIEEFIEGEIYHVDSIVSNGEFPYFKVSKYINTCLDFRNGYPLGSVTVDNTNFVNKVKEFTQEVCSFLNIDNQAIHLELIESNENLVFLEIGGRVGGGEIPFVTLKNEGVDLFDMWTKASLNMPINQVETKITGFLMMPNPFPTSYFFDEGIKINHPLITYQNINLKGSSQEFSYDKIPAKIHFMGENQLDVENAINYSINILNASIRKY